MQEIEEQEKLFQGKRRGAAGAPDVAADDADATQWRGTNDSGLLESVLSQVDSLHTSSSNSSGKYANVLFHLKKIFAWEGISFGTLESGSFPLQVIPCPTPCCLPAASQLAKS